MTRSGPRSKRRRRWPSARSSMSKPIAFRGGGFEPSGRRWASWLAFAAIILLWQLASSTGLLPALFMPSPAAVVSALYDLAASGKLGPHIGQSLYRIGLGWLFGTAAGLAVGLAMGIFSVARAIGIPITAALFPIPKIALLPLFILWFGIGESSKIVTIALGVFFPTVIAAYSSVDGVP